VKVFSDFARKPDFCNGTKVGILHPLIVCSKQNYITVHGNDDNGGQANSKSDICPDVRFGYHMGSSALALCKYSLYFTFKKNYHKSRSFNLNLKNYT
jgi:hypothetical protein